MTSVDSPFILNMLGAYIDETTIYCGSCSFSDPGHLWPAQSPLKRVNGAVRWRVGGGDETSGPGFLCRGARPCALEAVDKVGCVGAQPCAPTGLNQNRVRF